MLGMHQNARFCTTLKNLTKVENSGIVGLRNLGNTCFMNSVIQCLSNTSQLQQYCTKERYTSDVCTASSMRGALIKTFASLLHSIWKNPDNESCISPHAFKNQIQKFAPRFVGYNQQDAQEFLRYLLQGLHEDVNRITFRPRSVSSHISDDLSDKQKATQSWNRYLRLDDSKIVDLFVGQLKSSLKCTVCGHVSVTFDPFWDLSLPIPKTSGQASIQQCLNLFTKEETLEGDEKPVNLFKMQRKKKMYKKSYDLEVSKNTCFAYPSYLKRFSPHDRYPTKLNSTVNFPINNLDLNPFASDSNKGQNLIYNLYAVSNHSGSTYSGHYTAYCKHPNSGVWHDFNDSK
ncbi:Ubiquitin carboxyl-terminal hydrolase 2 [Nymphon striatum]|nr:Ubiquitin carboxyl-terminal hydrolase 2 [Nymphon striatum]